MSATAANCTKIQVTHSTERSTLTIVREDSLVKQNKNTITIASGKYYCINKPLIKKKEKNNNTI
jgi:hypothetical protein